MNNFTRKGYGRIFVSREQDIEDVKNEIKDMDEYEYGYMPEDLISVFNDDIRMVYVHKFCDLDLDHLKVRLFKKGIDVLIIDNGHGEYFHREEDK